MLKTLFQTLAIGAAFLAPAYLFVQLYKELDRAARHREFLQAQMMCKIYFDEEQCERLLAGWED